MKKWLMFFLVLGFGIAVSSLGTSCRREVCPAYRSDKDKVDDTPSDRVTKKGLVKRKRQKTFY